MISLAFVPQQPAPAQQIDILSGNITRHVPWLTRYDTGNVFLTYNRGTGADNAEDMTIQLARVINGSVGTPSTFVAAAGGSTSVQNGGMGKLANGTLIHVFARLTTNGSGGGVDSSAYMRLRISADGGLTWTAEAALSGLSDAQTGLAFGGAFQTQAGTVLIPFHKYTSATVFDRWVARSADNGATWTRAQVDASGGPYCEGQIVQEAGGTLVQIFRDNSAGGWTWLSTSTDDGLTWSAVAQTNIPNPASRTGIVLDGTDYIISGNDSAVSRTNITVWRCTARVTATFAISKKVLVNVAAANVQYPIALKDGADFMIAWSLAQAATKSAISVQRVGV